MKVHELIEILEEMDADAKVFIVVGANWPFEHYVHGVAARRDVNPGDDEHEEEAPPPPDRWSASASELPRNEVLIVAGSQARYGDPGAWEVARRA